MRIPAASLLLFPAIVLFAGCSTYVTPGPKADLADLAPVDIKEGFETKPSNPFPASIAAVRLQGPQYTNYSVKRSGGRYGSGRYSVITVHEVETPAQLARIAALPQVEDVISLNRMLLPERIDSDRDLRAAASRLRADLLLLYTFETTFFDSDKARPLTVITLGLSPTRKIRVTTTASALLVDTRTGYVYAAFEATEQSDVRATSWGSADSADDARKANERAAFDKLVGELATTWPRLLARYGAGRAGAEVSASP